MWLKRELAELEAGPSELRKFALVFGGAVLALGGLAWYRGSGAATYLFAAGLLVILVGLLAPIALRGLYYAWMTVGLILGTIVTAIILTVVFLVALTPIALVMRLLGKDPLHRELDPDADSYWIRRPETGRDRDRLEKYF